MVTATATRVRVLRTGVTAGVMERNVPNHTVQAIDWAGLELESQSLRQAEEKALRKTAAKRRRVDSALDQIASYW